MDTALRAVEVTGTIDEKSHLHLDEPLPIAGPSRVRVIILLPEAVEIGEKAWLHAAVTSPSFDFLREAAEDIYTLNDGVPFHDDSDEG